MSQERTEKATPKRQAEARKEGNVCKSQDLNHALVLSIAFALFYFFSPAILDKLKFALSYAFTHLHPAELAINNISSILTFYQDIFV